MKSSPYESMMPVSLPIMACLNDSHCGTERNVQRDDFRAAAKAQSASTCHAEHAPRPSKRALR